MTEDTLKATDEKFCIECGSMVNFRIDTCPKCGAYLSTQVKSIVNLPSKGKKKMTAAILALLLGGIGIHKVYLGKAWIGTIYLIFFWTLIPAIIGFIEGVFLLFMNDSDFNSKYNTIASPVHTKTINVDTRPPFDTPAVSEKTFESSGWSTGNFFYPDSLTLASDGIIYRKGALLGSTEEHINYRAIASFRIINRFLLSDVCIETSGGSQPIIINGLWSNDAIEIQKSIRAINRSS
jgi:TM2 domain-containing membrane protein YozV